MGNNSFKKKYFEHQWNCAYIQLCGAWLDILCLVVNIRFDAGILEVVWHEIDVVARSESDEATPNTKRRLLRAKVHRPRNDMVRLYENT